MTSSLFRVMVLPASPLSNMMVSPACESRMASRSDPMPLSLVLVTIRVLGTRRFSSSSSTGRIFVTRNGSRRRWAPEGWAFVCAAVFNHWKNLMQCLLFRSGYRTRLTLVDTPIQRLHSEGAGLIWPGKEKLRSGAESDGDFVFQPLKLFFAKGQSKNLPCDERLYRRLVSPWIFSVFQRNDRNLLAFFALVLLSTCRYGPPPQSRQKKLGGMSDVA